MELIECTLKYTDGTADTSYLVTGITEISLNHIETAKWNGTTQGTTLMAVEFPTMKFTYIFPLLAGLHTCSMIVERHPNTTLHMTFYDAFGVLVDDIPLPTTGLAHSGHDVVDNEVCGKAFKYCRDCKVEV